MDNTLVGSARNGDQRAFAKLVEEYYRPIYGLAFSAVGNWQAAEDVAQDTFLVAWVNMAKLRTLDAFGAWLRRIARNLSCNWVRSECYRRALRERRDALAIETGHVTDSAPDNLARADVRAEIWAALATLSPPLREAVVLFYLEENSIAQTAAVLGVTENSVKKRLQHARPKLRRYFETQWKAEMERERRRIKSSEAGERFMAAAALGPVSGLAGKVGAGAGLWLHSALHGEGIGRLASLLATGGALAKPGMVALAVAAVAGAGILWHTTRQAPVTGSNSSTAQTAEPALDSTRAVAVETALAITIAEEDVSGADDAQHPGNAASGVAGETAQLVTVTGRVVDDDKRPIPGAAVTVVASGVDVPGAALGASFGAAGGAGGVSAFGGGASGGILQTGLGEPEGGDASESSGRVAVSAGDGLAFARNDPHRDTLYKALFDETRRFTVRSASDGAFSLADVPGDGLLIISAEAAGYCMHGTTVSPASGASTSGLTLTLKPGVSVEGEALSARGQPITDGLVQITSLAWSRDGASGQWARSSELWGWTRTDSLGRFTLAVEDPGYATVVVRSESDGTATFQAIPLEPGARAELRFAEPSVIRGRIARHDGTPAANETVQLTGHAGTIIEGGDQRAQSRGETSTPAHEATTDATGAYEIVGIDPQIYYTASIFDEEGKPLVTGIELETPVAGRTLVWDYTIPRPITVKGVVKRGRSGDLAADAVILCKPAGQALEDGIAIAMPVARATADSEGAFEMRITTGPGAYAFGIQTPAGFRSLQEREVRDGESVVLNLALPGSWSRNFLVLDKSGKPLPGVSVHVAVEGDEMNYAYPERTGTDGRIQVTGLVAGESVTCRFRYERCEAESETVTGQDGTSLPEETIVMDTSV